MRPCEERGSRLPGSQRSAGEEGGGERGLYRVCGGRGWGGAGPTARRVSTRAYSQVNARTPAAGRLLSFHFRGSRIRPC